MQELFNDLWAPLAFIAIGSLIFAVGRWLGAANADRASFEDITAEVRCDLKEILMRLPKVDSTIRLTELGKQVSEAVGAGTLARELAPDLLQRAAGKRPHEIFRLCTDYINDTFEPTREQRDLFHATARERTVSLTEVLQVIVVELWDLLLERAAPASEKMPRPSASLEPTPAAP